MKNNIITEDQIISVLNKVLLEESSKVKREEFTRVQFKLDELNNSLGDAIKEIRKIEDTIPSGLENISNPGLTSIYSSLYNAQKRLNQLRERIRHHKKASYSQQIKEKKI